MSERRLKRASSPTAGRLGGPRDLYLRRGLASYITYTERTGKAPACTSEPCSGFFALGDASAFVLVLGRRAEAGRLRSREENGASAAPEPGCTTYCTHFQRD